MGIYKVTNTSEQASAWSNDEIAIGYLINSRSFVFFFVISLFFCVFVPFHAILLLATLICHQNEKWPMEWYRGRWLKQLLSQTRLRFNAYHQFSNELKCYQFYGWPNSTLDVCLSDEKENAKLIASFVSQNLFGMNLCIAVYNKPLTLILSFCSFHLSLHHRQNENICLTNNKYFITSRKSMMIFNDTGAVM